MMEIDIREVSEDERRCTKAFVRANKTVQKLIGELDTLEQWEPEKLHRQKNAYTRRNYTERGGIEKREYIVETNSRKDKTNSLSRYKVSGYSPGLSKVNGHTQNNWPGGRNSLEHEKGYSNRLFPQIAGNEKLLSVLQSRMKTKPTSRLENIQFPSVKETESSGTNDRQDKLTTGDKSLNLKDVVEKYRELNNSKARLNQEKTRLEERIYKASERLQLNTRTREEKERDRKAIKRHELKIERLQNKLKNEGNAKKQRKVKQETDNANKNSLFGTGSTHLQRQKQFREQGRELFRVNGKTAVGIHGYEIYYADDLKNADNLSETSEDSIDSKSVESDNGYVFFPPIPAPFEKKRPQSPIIIDETDSEKEISTDPNKIRLIKVPNRKRVAKRREKMLEQRERFARAHNIHAVSGRKETASEEPAKRRKRKPSGIVSKSQTDADYSTSETKLVVSSQTGEGLTKAEHTSKKTTQFDEKSLLVTKKVNGKLLQLEKEREKLEKKRQAGPPLRITDNRDLSRRRILYLMGALSVNHLYPPGIKGPAV